jgi:alpha-L-fucosidase
MRFLLLGFIIVVSVCSNAQKPKPTNQQLAWHENEFYLFIHFGPNTFTGQEWGHGDEPADAFLPTELDCKQWTRVARQAGAKGIIITAKHHDGFCLWPSKFSKHTVRESKWKNGKGDVLMELSKACKEDGLKFGVYISPWDRNHPDYGTEKYNDVFVNMMKEIFSSYGPIWELWWDGANGEGPNGKLQKYDWKRYEQTIRKISPKTIIFSDIGPDVRWVGNENGFAGLTNWNYLDTAGFLRGLGAPATDTLNQGNVHGKNWIPAECDVSIRPGWFYHSKEDNKVKSAEELFNLYLHSVGRGANLLLNVPPDQRGLFHEKDVEALIKFKALRDESFANNLLKNASTYWDIEESDSIKFQAFDTTGNFYGIDAQGFTVELPGPEKMNCIVLREAIHLGQSISGFRIILYNGNEIVREVSGTTVGRKRIVTFPITTVTSFKVKLADERDNIMGVAAYRVAASF